MSSRTAHTRAPIVDAKVWLAAVGDYIAQNDTAFREMPDLFPKNAIAALTAASNDALARLRPLLLSTRRAGAG